ncbi:bifunctional riboflavin kinase/FAD synthetase [Teredinibacter purpureus]|uniref:bifunctional riboflavin kinase/FAD synthetase n=1 Tax=Teredinibacter purpureus TaxID=2731756 RepID=UPI0005F8808C|nr:bifunctional riboflavin kinase/FAD synthetase [Teredinibacter purpureus]
MIQQEFINGLGRLSASHRGCVVTIGSFDGVHRGHQVLLEQLKQKAASLGLPSLVMVFEPQPFEYFSREQAPARLMRLREKVSALFEQGVDRVLCLKFDSALRKLSAQAFVDQILVERLGVKHLVVGDDFRFGCDRKGDYRFLQSCGRQMGFAVCDTHTQLEAGERISSTRIRDLLSVDNFQLASELLGQDYSVSGRVIYGKQLGRTLGFPTANIGLGRYRAAVQGVYAVTVQSRAFSGVTDAVANVGVRPTVEGGKKPLLEVHLLNQSYDLYGQCIKVVFKHKIRNEKRFDGLPALQAQIEHDVITAREWFAKP